VLNAGTKKIQRNKVIEGGVASANVFLCPLYFAVRNLATYPGSTIA